MSDRPSLPPLHRSEAFFEDLPQRPAPSQPRQPRGPARAPRRSRLMPSLLWAAPLLLAVLGAVASALVLVA
jgi:hypothetical protein